MGSRGDNRVTGSIRTHEVEKCLSISRSGVVRSGGARVEPAASGRTKVYQSIVYMYRNQGYSLGGRLDLRAAILCHGVSSTVPPWVGGWVGGWVEQSGQCVREKRHFHE